MALNISRERAACEESSQNTYTARDRVSTSDNYSTAQLSLELESRAGQGSRVISGWAIEPAPTGHPYPYWLWSIPGNFWLGAFHIAEAERAIEMLGDARHYATHSVAATMLGHHWGFIATGKPPKPKPPKPAATVATPKNLEVA